MKGSIADGVRFSCPDDVVPASYTQGQGHTRRTWRLDSLRPAGVLPSRCCRAGHRLYKGTQKRGRLRQLSVRNVAGHALVQEGWPLWAALSACAAGGQVRLQWNMVEHHKIFVNCVGCLGAKGLVLMYVWCLCIHLPCCMIATFWCLLVGTGAKNLVWLCGICTSALIVTGTCLLSWRRLTSHLPSV